MADVADFFFADSGSGRTRVVIGRRRRGTGSLGFAAAAAIEETRRLLTNRPCSSFVSQESDSKERLRVSNWIVQGLYNYAVNKIVEL